MFVRARFPLWGGGTAPPLSCGESIATAKAVIELANSKPLRLCKGAKLCTQKVRCCIQTGGGSGLFAGLSVWKVWFQRSWSQNLTVVIGQPSELGCDPLCGPKNQATPWTTWSHCLLVQGAKSTLSDHAHSHYTSPSFHFVLFSIAPRTAIVIAPAGPAHIPWREKEDEGLLATCMPSRPAQVR